MKKDHISVNKNFFKDADKLRDHFDSVFAKPLEATGERFCWDYWHVPDSYTHLRTPAWEFFPEDIYTKWHNAILEFGRTHLGCHEITPPWMSCYVDGCKQNLHADLPHGPWAFVYSISPKNRKFIGGETKILKPEILDYWSNLDRNKGLHQADIIDHIKPEYNQLLVFDPRYPHGVEEVRGIHDVCEGRLVIHGWFTEPEPWVEGGLEDSKDLADSLNKFIELVISDVQALDGLLTFRITIEKDGSISDIKALSNTLVGLEKPISTKKLKSFSFPKAKSKSVLTLPLIFSQ